MLCEARLTPPTPPSQVWPNRPQAAAPERRTGRAAATPSTSSIFQRFCVTVNITTNNRPAPRRPRPARPVGASRPSRRTPPPDRPAGRCAESRGRFAQPVGGERAAHHGHQRVHRHQAGHAVQFCALITLKPNQPTIRIQAPRAKTGCWTAGGPTCCRFCDSGHGAAEQQHGGQGNPAANGMHHHRAGKVMEGRQIGW